MRDLVIITIEKNFAAGLHDLGRCLFVTLVWPDPILVTFETIKMHGKTELLNPWLKSLSNEQLLGVLESQHCERYR